MRTTPSTPRSISSRACPYSRGRSYSRIQDQAGTLQSYEFDLTQKVQQDALEQLKAKGMLVNSVDLVAFGKAVEPVYKKFTAKFGTKLLDQVQATK